MTDEGEESYRSGDIVDRYLHDRLSSKGVAWESPRQRGGKRLSSSTPSPSSSSPSSSSPSSSPSSPSASPSSSPSSSPSVQPRWRVSAPSSGEKGDPSEGSPAAAAAAAAPRRRPHGVQTRTPSCRRSRLHAVLQQAGAELDVIYQRDFLPRVSGQFLHLTPSAMRASLRVIGGELFVDGVNWGRVVAMLEFGAAMCAESAVKGTSWTAADVAAWMVEGLDGPLLRRWIEDNGGWDAFVEMYDRERPLEGCWSVRKVVGLVVLGAAGITLGALFTQK